jgi:diadenosine tetraphosphate (Ap4A) HIT family hydrolase
MAHWKDKWTFYNSNEYEYKFVGKYGAKGEKRKKRVKATPEQIKLQNQQNREKKLRRVIKANFLPNDLWSCLKYPKGTRKTLTEVKKDLRDFLTDMRKEYKKLGEQLKFIYRIEIGKYGGIHIHIIVNRSNKRPDTDLLIQEMWIHGRVNHETIYEYGGYKRLANYIVKKPDEKVEKQLSMFEEEDKKEFIKYSSSRNLIRPQPDRKTYRRWTMKKLIEEGPKPTPGYYIDVESIHYGVNKYTGMSYYQYTECRIDEIKSRSSPEWEYWMEQAANV